jgi:hypothetical protein
MPMTLVSTVTVGSGGAASIEFTNIPQTGKDLLIVHSMRSSDSTVYYEASITLNNDSGDNYSWRKLLGSGSSVSSDTASAVSVARASLITGANATSNTFGNSAIYISNYTSSSAKSISGDAVTENNATESYQALYAGRWTGTAAITSVTINRSSVQHSTASLYIIS